MAIWEAMRIEELHIGDLGETNRRSNRIKYELRSKGILLPRT